MLIEDDDIGEICTADHRILKGDPKKVYIDLKACQLDSCWYMDVDKVIALHPELFKVAEYCWTEMDWLLPHRKVHIPRPIKAQLLYAACTAQT